MYIYIYIYIYVLSVPLIHFGTFETCACTPASLAPDLPTNIAGFRGFDSSVILILRGGIIRYIGNFPESLSQAMLVGVMLVGR